MPEHGRAALFGISAEPKVLEHGRGAFFSSSTDQKVPEQERCLFGMSKFRVLSLFHLFFWGASVDVQ